MEVVNFEIEELPDGQLQVYICPPAVVVAPLQRGLKITFVAQDDLLVKQLIPAVDPYGAPKGIRLLHCKSLWLSGFRADASKHKV